MFDAWHDWNIARRELAVRAPEVSAQHLGEALAFAEEAHGDQMRPAGEPYVEHLLEVVEILVSGAGVRDEDLLVAAVLHDVVEDTDRTAGEIGERFGSRVEKWVDWVTKPAPEAHEDPAEVRDLYLLSLRSAPPEVLLLKLADRFSNVQRLDTHPRPEKRRSYYRETCRYLVPLATGVPWFEAAFEEWRKFYRHLEDGEPATA
ncbi:bifunctional (p)ppGpp synthetase/guanosine-3',5'-bis(diphosphate) 3'-pyrophosphohydrolase [Streptomyces qinzhouensis]|uniref:Bifunctional (P)ppGpp synthetase/guanosine-3',5'-bis(Diphosphate) 3'-pyrophosphohydrolase n=1 Tax=Streptomyces qinzhouensis TaxID=2599401 RepID=A0A5B8JII4_9ACTN|nr:bifunctional (p)ppGpp synthetase/guanosine-3',5'-bis(diphosphate) 3'-pyrophosphohydrolase [Streptomyces qinzhouensis]